ncbi:MAG: GNAT family N-acetyltransferase [Pseudonocardia sp.]|nr:GNAT family N-acetyltransferase [Pseudonocardia sp.]
MLELIPTPYDHPEVQRLVARIQAFYAERYGGGDSTLLQPEQFAPPLGHFVLGRVGSRIVACGGWRPRDAVGPADPELRDGDAEIKRMYVVPESRGLGHARAVLAELERTAAAAGRTRMILETGLKQPEAVALYESSGYAPMERFGVYRLEPESVCFCKSVTRSTRA